MSDDSRNISVRINIKFVEMSLTVVTLHLYPPVYLSKPFTCWGVDIRDVHFSRKVSCKFKWRNPAKKRSVSHQAVAPAHLQRLRVYLSASLQEKFLSISRFRKNIVTASSGPSGFRLGSNSDPLRVLFPTLSDAAGKSTGFTQRRPPESLN